MFWIHQEIGSWASNSHVSMNASQDSIFGVVKVHCDSLISVQAVVASSGKRIWMKESLGGQIMAVERDVREASLAILVALKAERSDFCFKQTGMIAKKIKVNAKDQKNWETQPARH